MNNYDPTAKSKNNVKSIYLLVSFLFFLFFITLFHDTEMLMCYHLNSPKILKLIENENAICFKPYISTVRSEHVQVSFFIIINFQDNRP